MNHKCNHTNEAAVRPEFTGTLAIKSGRHPILETVQAAGALVPNDVYCCESSSFQIVQGPKYVSRMLLERWLTFPFTVCRVSRHGKGIQGRDYLTRA